MSTTTPVEVPFREIYYNRGFGWSEGSSPPRGIYSGSVATREAGHAFGLGLFGMGSSTTTTR
jgi:hypothetical protein